MALQHIRMNVIKVQSGAQRRMEIHHFFGAHKIMVCSGYIGKN
jgi:hypothetical protein